MKTHSDNLFEDFLRFKIENEKLGYLRAGLKAWISGTWDSPEGCKQDITYIDEEGTYKIICDLDDRQAIMMLGVLQGI